MGNLKTMAYGLTLMEECWLMALKLYQMWFMALYILIVP